MPKQTTTAIDARTRRSRNSTRCETKGCSVPASSSGLSSGLLIALDRRPRRPEAGHARGAGLRLAADAVALLVPLRHRTALQAPVLLRVLVLRHRRTEALVLAAVRRQRRCV